MGGKVDEGIRKKEETEGKGRRIEGGGGGKGGVQGGSRDPQGGPREAPERSQCGPRRPREAPGAPQDPSILQEMHLIENHWIFNHFHRFQMMPQLKLLRASANGEFHCFFNVFCVLTGF